MLRFAMAYLIALFIFVVVDFVWLGLMAPRFYRPTLGDIAKPDVNFFPAFFFYAIYPIGLVIFAINPAFNSESMTTAIIFGALFGFFTYGTYDLTNHATLRNWTTQVTLVDASWGTILGAMTAGTAFLVANKFPIVG